MTRQAPDARFELRDVSDLAGCRAAVEIEKTVWGDSSDVVPASLLLVSAKRGGILIGAFERDVMQGFVWSMPGWRDGLPTHWSHMLAVLPEARGHGVGLALKRAQYERARDQRCALIEWTFDPLQAGNAHLNFHHLGVVATEYLVDVYGPLAGPLHRGTATDRLVAEWWIAEATPVPLPVPSVPAAIETGRRGDWLVPLEVRLDLDADQVHVPVPPRFSALQAEDTTVAQQWRAASRDAFQHYLGRGYRVVGFVRDPATQGGAYRLARPR